MRAIFCILFAATLLPVATGAEPVAETYSGPAAEQINAAIAENAASCEEDGGTQAMDYSQIVTAHDINGDGVPDPYFSFYATECSITPAYWSGSAGSQWNVYMSGEDGNYTEQTLTARAVKVVEFGRPVVLASVHASMCNFVRPCVEALIWDTRKSRFASIADAYNDTPEPWELE